MIKWDVRWPLVRQRRNPAVTAQMHQLPQHHLSFPQIIEICEFVGGKMWRQKKEGKSHQSVLDKKWNQNSLGVSLFMFCVHWICFIHFHYILFTKCFIKSHQQHLPVSQPSNITHKRHQFQGQTCLNLARAKWCLASAWSTNKGWNSRKMQHWPVVVLEGHG